MYFGAEHLMGFLTVWPSAQWYSYFGPADMMGQLSSVQNSVIVPYSMLIWLKKSTAGRRQRECLVVIREIYKNVITHCWQRPIHSDLLHLAAWLLISDCLSQVWQLHVSSNHTDEFLQVCSSWVWTSWTNGSHWDCEANGRQPWM